LLACFIVRRDGGLEFKREIPEKDETVKKLSSFVNTLGGLARSAAARCAELNTAAAVVAPMLRPWTSTITTILS
jgi:hypothetical protein